MPTIEAKVPVAMDVYASLPKRPDRVRECVAAAAQAMGAEAALSGRVLADTPRLVDQVPHPIIDQVELVFQAETVKR